MPSPVVDVEVTKATHREQQQLPATASSSCYEMRSSQVLLSDTAGDGHIPEGLSAAQMHRLVAAQLDAWAVHCDANTAVAYSCCADTLRAAAASASQPAAPSAAPLQLPQRKLQPATAAPAASGPAAAAQPTSMDFFASSPWDLGGVSEDSFPLPTIVVKPDVKNAVAVEMVPQKGSSNIRNPFNSLSAGFDFKSFQDWLCASKPKIKPPTAKSHAEQLNRFLGMFEPCTDLANLVHFVRSLQQSRTLMTLFQSWHWNSEMTWTHKQCVTLGFFVEYQASECFHHKRKDWQLDLDQFEKMDIRPLKVKCDQHRNIRKAIRKENDFNKMKTMPSSEEMQWATHMAFCLLAKLHAFAGHRLLNMRERALGNTLTIGPLQVNAMMGRLQEWDELTRAWFREQIVDRSQAWIGLINHKTLGSQGLAGKDVCSGNSKALQVNFSFQVPPEHDKGEKTKLFIPPTAKRTKNGASCNIKQFSKIFFRGRPVNANMMRKKIETMCRAADKVAARKRGGAKTLQESASSGNAHTPLTGINEYVMSNAEEKAADGARSFEHVFHKRLPWPTQTEIDACPISIEDALKKNFRANVDTDGATFSSDSENECENGGEEEEQEIDVAEDPSDAENQEAYVKAADDEAKDLPEAAAPAILAPEFVSPEIVAPEAAAPQAAAPAIAALEAVPLELPAPVGEKRSADEVVAPEIHVPKQARIGNNVKHGNSLMVPGVAEWAYTQHEIALKVIAAMPVDLRPHKLTQSGQLAQSWFSNVLIPLGETEEKWVTSEENLLQGLKDRIKTMRARAAAAVAASKA